MKRRTTLSILIAMVLLVVTSFVVYAAFTVEEPFAGDVGYHKIENQTLDRDVSNAISFTEPGEEKEIKLTLENEDSRPYAYNYQITTTETISDSSLSLYKMIYVYYNEEYIGVLSDVILNSVNMPIDFVMANSSIQNTFTFKLHNASYEIIDQYDLSSISINFNCNLNTTNAQEYIFVGTTDEFTKAIDDCNRVSGKTIVLTSSVTSNVSTISNDVNIDLYGKTLTLSNNINVTGTSAKHVKLHIQDSKGNGKLDTNQFVTNEYSYITFDTLTDITSFVDLTSCSVDEVLSVVKAELNSMVYVERNVNILGNYLAYVNYSKLSISFDGVTSTTGQYTINSSTNEVIEVELTTNSTSEIVYMKSFGNNDVLNNIISGNLSHLYKFLSSENTYDVAYDLYLPTSIREYNATISWHSSNQSLMLDSGKIIGEYGKVVLTATIKLYDKAYTVDYHVFILKQNNLTKLQILASKVEQEILFTKVYNKDDTDHTNSLYELPVADSTSANYYTKWVSEDLDIIELSYEVYSAHYYLSVTNDDKNSDGIYEYCDVFLNQITYDRNARIKIKGKFENDDREYETDIAVRILLSESDLKNKIFDDVQAYLDSIDVLQLILNTRSVDGIINESGDFSLLEKIHAVKLAYEEVDTSNLYSIADYIVKFDLTKLSLTDQRIPINVKIMTTVEGVEESTAEKILYFNVPGALTPYNFPAFDFIKQDTEGNDYVDSTNNTSNIFYTMKLQVAQQSDSPKYNESINMDTLKAPVGDSKDMSYIDKLYALKPYILMYDILKTNELIFEYSDVNMILDKYDVSILIKIFDWAVSSDKNSIGNNTTLKDYFDDEYYFITSDGESTLSDAEIEAILYYCEKYAEFPDILNDYINVQDNRLSESEIVELKKTLMSDKYFVMIFDWIQTEDIIDLYDFYLNNYLNYGLDGTQTIEQFSSTTSLPLEFLEFTHMISEVSDPTAVCNDEERVLIWYLQKKLPDNYDNFYTIWLEDIVRKDNVNEYGEISNTHSLTYNITGGNGRGGNTSKTTNQCYDPIFMSLLKWATHTSEQDDDVAGSLISIKDYLTNSGVSKLFNIDNLNNILTFPQNENISSIKNDYNYQEFEWNFIITYSYHGFTDHLSEEEWNILKSYLSLYYLPTDIVNLGLQNNPTFQSLKYDDVIVDNSYTVRGQALNFGPVPGNRLSDIAIEAFITKINSYYNTGTDEILFSYNSLLEKCVSTTSFEQPVTNENRLTDKVETISYDEYYLLYDELENSLGDFNNDKNVSDTELLLKEMLIGTFLPVDMIFNDNTIDKSNLLLNTIDSKLDDFDLIIEYITSFGNPSGTALTYNSDGLETLSLEEIQKLVNIYKSNSNFTKELGDAISTYYWENDYIVKEDKDNVDREISKDEITEIDNKISQLIGNNADKSLKYKYLTVNKISNAYLECFTSLRYFTNLDSLSFKGRSTSDLFESSDDANMLFDIVTNSSKQIKKLTFNYANLTNIKTISRLLELESFDIKGNPIKDIAPLLELLMKKDVWNENEKEKVDASSDENPYEPNYVPYLEYINIYDTEVNYKYGEYVYGQLFKEYYNKNGEKPRYYYNKNGVETKYDIITLDTELSAKDLCYLLKEIESIPHDYLVLPKKVYATGNAVNGIDIVWAVVEGRAYISIDNNRIIRSSGDAAEAVVSATITYGGETYTRYFVVTLPKTTLLH